MNKYHNKKVTSYDGIQHDSKKEARRWCELKLLQKAGKISELQRQVEFELIPAQYETYERFSKKGEKLADGTRTVERKCCYIADFVYTENGQRVVEDTKGYKRGSAYAIFAIKRKLMLYVHHVRIREV